jgi:microsomal dipeptidase-like Zn-dependent dipeptidase
MRTRRRFGPRAAASVMGLTLVLALGGRAAAQDVVRLDAPYNTAPGRPLRGFVDMHAHWMAHLGFGGKIVHGAPDVGVPMLPASIVEGSGCNRTQRPARTRAEALGSCMASHGGYDALHNSCGDLLRPKLLASLENKGKQHHHAPDGHTTARWPAYNDITHQQMWVEWVKRAHQGGLRVMVVLAVNNSTLAGVMKGSMPQDDRAVGDLQLAAMKTLADRHAWMEIALSPTDLRRIVGQDKLAIVLGSELDDIGNLTVALRKDPASVTDQAIAAEVRRLHALGVRYIFPVHLVDNAFGGTAAYIHLFNVANRNQFGRWWDLICAPKESGIRWRHEPPRSVPESALALSSLGITTEEAVPLPPCAESEGHMNARRLQRRGKVALNEMMRLGMMIDIDHASRRTIDDIIAFTRPVAYPLVSGHNGLAVAGPRLSEHSRTTADYEVIAERGGLAGVGWGDRTAGGYLRGVRDVMATGLRAIALGTDINGLEPTPGGPCDRQWGAGFGLPLCSDSPMSGKEIRPPLVYSDTFPMARDGSLSWDYNQKGVAHYGLIPDFLRHAEQEARAQQREPLHEIGVLYHSAEAFARTWERAAQLAPTVAATAVARHALEDVCDSDHDCATGRCDAGNPRTHSNTCVLQDGRGQPGQYCTHGTQCASGSCVEKTCRAATSQPLGGPCDVNAACISNRCDVGSFTTNTRRCIPNDGTGTPGDYCTHSNHCVSKSCVAKVCVASSSVALGEACTSHEVCDSRRCDLGTFSTNTRRCIPNDGTGSTGSYCTHNNQCRTRRCSVSCAGCTNGRCQP